MELLYIWIGEHNNIKEQGFNFSSKHSFDFKYKNENGQIIGDIVFKNNPNYIDDFFDKNGINVTAIIGENGTGKTSLIYHIITSWSFLNALYDKPVIFIFQNIKKNEEGIYVYYHESMQVNILFKCKHYQKLGKSNSGKTLEDIVFITPIPKSFFILYSSLLQDNFKNLLDFLSIINISTEGLYSGYQLEFIFYEEIEKQAIFISSELRKEVDIPFELPEYLNISFPITDSELFSKMEEYTELSGDTENSDIIPYVNGFIDNKHWYDISKGYAHLLKKRIITTVLVFRITGQINFGKDIRDDIDKIDENYLEKVISDTSLLDKIDTSGYLKELISTISIHKNFVKAQMMTIGGDEMFGTAYLSIPIEELEAIQNILRAFKQLSPNLSIHKVEWRKLSFGENILLNIYSRFYYAAQEFKQHDNRVEDITIFIDEGELGFHPQWQKKYLKILIEFLPKMFKGKEIQLVLTSHSPFLVSDLPKENIIFLRKGDKEDGDLDGKCIVVKENDRKYQILPNTFGQNIHTLFADSFFMEGGLIGEFSKKKIQKTIEWLNEHNNKENADIHKKIIEMIGEPILKEKLKDMYKYKMGVEVEIEELEKQKTEIEERIKQLKNPK